MDAALSESPTDPERARLIEAVTTDAATYVGVDLARDTPADIVATVNAVIVKIVFGEPHPIPESEEKDLVLGCLWGAQVAREFGWSWAEIRFGNMLDVAVVSPGKEMVIYPFTFVADCIAKRCICTVALSFNLLHANRLVFAPNSYESIMERVAHIVPPYILEPKKANHTP
jgi:hypothetical protein